MPNTPFTALRQHAAWGRTDWFKQSKRGLLGQMLLSPLVTGPGHACLVRTKDQAPRASLSTRHPHLCPLGKCTVAIFEQLQNSNGNRLNTPNTKNIVARQLNKNMVEARQHSALHIKESKDTTVNTHNMTAAAKPRSAILGGSQEGYE